MGFTMTILMYAKLDLVNPVPDVIIIPTPYVMETTQVCPLPGKLSRFWAFVLPFSGASWIGLCASVLTISAVLMLVNKTGVDPWVQVLR